jgi:DNA-binding IscR family transcriptional regulator
MAAVEEGTRMTRCGGDNGEFCLPGHRCLTHGLWDALGEHIGAFLDRVSLQEVIEGMPGRKARGGAAQVAVE